MNHLVHCPTDYAGEFRKLPKRLRRMFIHAFQSYIFNIALTKASERGIALPEKVQLVGYDTKLDNEIGAIIESELKAEEIKLEHFKLGRMPELAEPGLERETFMKINSFHVIYAADGEAKIIFELDKGSYATVLLMNFINA
jgi:tRNA pseudouridine13 synthase